MKPATPNESHFVMPAIKLSIPHDFVVSEQLAASCKEAFATLRAANGQSLHEFAGKIIVAMIKRSDYSQDMVVKFKGMAEAAYDALVDPPADRDLQVATLLCFVGFMIYGISIVGIDATAQAIAAKRAKNE